PLGVGWSLGGLSEIARCAQTIEQDGASGSVNLDSDDRFCLDGQRLLLVSGAYGASGSEYRTEIDAIARIKAFGNMGSGPASFAVEHKNGSVSHYGDSPDSQIQADGEVLTWARNRLEDSAGNYILYHYTESSNPIEFVISQIEYTGNGSQSPFAKLDFIWASDRSDATRVYIGGVELQQTQYLERIDSRAKKNAASAYTSLRSYFMSYADDGMGRKSLQSIEECNNQAKQACFAPTSFTWVNALSGIGNTISHNNLFPNKQVLYGLQVADVSGDGRPDVLYTRKSGPNYKLHIESPSASGIFSGWGGSYTLPKNADGLPPKVFGMDLDADGYQDVIYRKHVGNNRYQWAALRSTGSSLLPEIILSPHSFIVNEDQAGIESRISVVDFNGDGISDLMYNKTSAVGDQHDIEVAVNTWTPGGTLGLSSPIEISSQFGDLFPSPVGDAQGNLWETFAKPNFTDWNTTQLQGRNTPDARVFDFNGDGAVDVLIKVSREYRNCISNCPKEQSLPGPGEVGAQASPVYQFTDVAFWVLMDSTGSEGYTQNIIAVGTGCILPDPCNATPGLPASDFIWPVDINADALADIAFSDNGNGWHYRLNTGDGFTATQDITNTPSPLPGGQQDLVRFEDFNGDGYPDLVYPSGEQTQSATWRVIYNRFGQAFDDPTVTSIKAGNVGGTTNVENDASIFADFNGDGKSDHFYINFNSQGKPSDSDLYLGRNQLNGSFNTAPTNVITAINNGLGALTIISYSPLTDSSVYTRMNDARNTDWGAGSVVYDLIAPIYVVNKVSGSAPTFASTSATSSVEYHYVGAKMQSGGRGFLGFGEVISFDPQDGIRTNTRYRQDSPFIGMPADTTVSLVSINQKFDTVSNNSATSPATWGAVTASTPATSPSGTKLSYAINEWAGLVTAGGAVFPHIAKSLERRYTLQGVFDRKVLTSNVPDENGNLTSIIQKTYSTDGDSAFAIRTTSNTYKDNISNWHFGLLGTSIVTHTRTGQTSITRQSSYDYDTDTGILDKEIIEPNNSAFKVTKDYQLDRFGNYIRTTVTGFGMVSRVSEAEYDSYGRFVIESRNDLGQITHKVNDHDAFGNVLESENIDGVMTFYAADFMGRPFVSYTETGKFSKTLHSNSSASCPAGTAIKTTTSGGGVPDEVLCQDVRGRTIRTATVGFDGTLIYVDQYFNASGRAERVSEPYFAGSARYWNLSAYDALGRPTTLTSASGDDQIFEYDADANIACTATDVRVKQVTNGLGQVHVEVSNALGELVETYDDACGNVRYENDAVGNLTRVTGADHEVVSMSYDLAGRKIAMNDPDKGAWQYSYNPLGELIRQLDSKFQAIDFVYDTLGRVTDRLELSNVSSLTDSTVTTHHHETTNFENSTSALVRGKGQPINIVYRANDSGAVQHQRIFSYDSFGRVSEASSVLEGSPFSEVTTYDQFGRIFQRFDASGDNRGLRSHYNTRGYLSRLQEAREGTLGTVYQEILAMDARGNATQVRLGNGVDVFASYDAPSGRLNDMSAYDGSIELQNVDYLFDVLGNLKERHDLSVSTNLKETFNYDDLNRLLNVNLSVNDGTATQTLALSYDAAGNFTYKSDVGGYLYNGNQPHAVKNAGGVTYNYDNNGNQLAGGGRTISYTVFDKPELISSNGQSVAFGYGITNARYKREDISGAEVQKTTLYMGSVERIEEGGSISYKRHLGGAAIATYYAASGSQSIHYLLKDHIGSIHTVLDEGKQITATMHFSAFGQRQDIDWQTPLTAGLYAPLNDITTRGFTGHEQVDDFGIIHMNGRIYDAKLGRFLQADPIVQAPRNSQNLNRYSYVLNNPLSFTDPSGFFLKRLVRKWGRVIVAAVSGYFTFNTSYAWASKILGASSAAGTSITTFAGFKAAAASVAGATSGFVSAGVLSETARGAVRGAFAGALTIGTNKYYGHRYDLGRVVVETLIGGANSRILGGKFDDGLRSAFTTSVLNYANYRMRRTAGAVADKNPANTGKASRGFYGDQTARAGALRTPNPEYPDDSGFPFLKCDSTAGACQGNEVFHPQDIVNSRLGPFFYPPYGTVDYVLESFAGPHDWLRLKTGSYDPLTGLNLYREGIAEVWDGIKNYGLIPVAAPFAAAAILVTSPNLHLVTQFQIHGN
ncbi:MAG: hypothetical protein HKN15_10740, partial [Xanthomonadales bacterium]|nr:hypothetical protein [Xanthomonadales bacterium]